MVNANRIYMDAGRILFIYKHECPAALAQRAWHIDAVTFALLSAFQQLIIHNTEYGL